MALAAIGLTLAACTPEVDDVFDTSTSERVQEFSKNTLDILTAAPNGWRMEYYGATTYGGYNVLVKFGADYYATVASEQAGGSHNAGIGTDGKCITAQSHFKLEQSQGVVLSFDEYNDVLMYYSQPKNPNYGSDGYGMEGDFEFRVISATAEKVELVGKKGNSKILMYPMPADQTWEDYLKDVAATDKWMASRSYKLEVEGSEREINVSKSYRRLVFDYVGDDGNTVSVVAPYITTPKGYVFYKPVEVDSQAIDGFDKGDTDEYFTTPVNSKIKLVTYIPTLFEAFSDFAWYVDYFTLGPVAQPGWDYMRDKLATSGPNKKRERLYWAYFGKDGTKVGFFMNAGGNSIFYGIKFTEKGENHDRVEMRENSTASTKVGKTYYSNFGLKQALNPFTNVARGRTFQLETDNVRRPSYMILTEIANPENVIKLWADPVYYVYGDLDKEEQ